VVNLMWMISHPDRMAPDETDDYHHIFLASDIYARVLRDETRTPVSVLHQASDPSVFHPPAEKSALASPVLFVGNSRREYRTLVRWCVEKNIDVSIHGSLWDGLIPAGMIGGTYIDNADLHRWYGSCGVLLNDHWDTMRDSGFLSNRLFDGSAAGAFIITDEVRGLATVFGDTIETAADVTELKEKVDYYLANPAEAEERARRARSIVLAGHTFDHRAEQNIETYRQFTEGTGSPQRIATGG
jgi:spore maturation protein CgeB